MSTIEGLCTEMGDREGRGLVPHPLTPLPAGPSTWRVQPGATAELEQKRAPSLSFALWTLARAIPCFVFS
jgi:hypothetical protein